MGIGNVHILIHPEIKTNPDHKLEEYVAAKRVLEHRAGQHPYGSMRRDCPLCVSRK